MSSCELKVSQPDFIRVEVPIARVGAFPRVHLILATQKLNSWMTRSGPLTLQARVADREAPWRCVPVWRVYESPRPVVPPSQNNEVYELFKPLGLERYQPERRTS